MTEPQAKAETKPEKFIACDRCGIVFAERVAIGPWDHYLALGSREVVLPAPPGIEQICDHCMN